MKRLEFMRRNMRFSQQKLGEVAGVNVSYICYAESRGMTLYPNQAKRLSDALGWKGDPMELFDDLIESSLSASDSNAD